MSEACGSPLALCMHQKLKQILPSWWRGAGVAEGRVETSWPGGSSPAERGGNTDKGSNRSGGTVAAALAWLRGPLGPRPLFQGVPKVVPKGLEQREPLGAVTGSPRTQMRAAVLPHPSAAPGGLSPSFYSSVGSHGDMSTEDTERSGSYSSCHTQEQEGACLVLAQPASTNPTTLG